MLPKELGDRIKARREKRGLKQQDIANALDISPQAVSKWERGGNAPDIWVLEPLAQLLGVTVDWLLTGSEERRDVFEAAVMVSSVRGAHGKALQMAPRDFALWANGIFFQLTEIALRHDAVPVKYMGDGFLCFFSGPRRCERALETAVRATTVVSADLVFGLNNGEIFLGSVGHPDYARPDIMGEAVNVAFLTLQWADKHARSGVAVTQAFASAFSPAKECKTRLRLGKPMEIRFRGAPVRVHEALIRG